MYFLMQGSPFIYQGQEIGMTNTVFTGPDDFQDVFAKNHFAIRRSEGLTDAQITKEIAHTSRDNARTPMQWNAEKNAGFSTGTPWLKVNPNYQQINVEAESKDPESILNFYKKLIRLRREHKVFIYGTFELILQDHPDVFAYTRTLNNQEAIVVCNLRGKNTKVDLKSDMKLVLANYQGVRADLMDLKPFECRVYLKI
ncbi:Oligo-1,6-glucosidase [compost metagenome]